MKKAILLVLLFAFSSFSYAVSIDKNLLNKAKSGDRVSQEEVAKFYEFSGEEGESLSWLYTAFENGSGYAAGKIAKAYYEGSMGLKRDRYEAWSWYRKGANLSDRDSLLFMSNDYWERGSSTNQKIAFQHLVQCISELKDSECNVRYAKLRRSVSGNLDTSALEAVQRAEKMGYPEAYTELAFYYENGYIVEKDISKAYSYLQKAASKNEKNALEKIGEAYLHAHKYGLNKDEKKGVDALEKAGVLGNGAAYRTLGDYYFADKKNTINLNKAINYYQKGVALDNPYAAWNLASLYSEYSDNLGRRQSSYWKEMAKLMTLAADAGLLTAQLELASSYNKGEMGLSSRSKAKYYYELAAKQGSGEAKLKLKGFN
ncbi:tetratricopeptide repeat protein [Psychrobacter sp. LV10R520-6]|uniref:tetratricopeptide repeat protein n=1 Tax=Psychrobacter sp. LV10R520-6 TaxID=1415574 RepID=UPI0024C940B1|nr:tetratricopeptide repeat protein [Psychrobacter sp. LV10R520-6]SNT71045.1 TPR repeat [Psychrobacter sp. LV10R520-6]